MSAPFVTSLRSRTGTIVIPGSGDPHITVRVEMPEVWDVVRVEAPPTTPVAEMKVRALQALKSDEPYPERFVLKLHGFEVLDELASLHDAGAVNGSIFLLTSRRRRPVR